MIGICLWHLRHGNKAKIYNESSYLASHPIKHDRQRDKQDSHYETLPPAHGQMLPTVFSRARGWISDCDITDV